MLTTSRNLFPFSGRYQKRAERVSRKSEHVKSPGKFKKTKNTGNLTYSWNNCALTKCVRTQNRKKGKKTFSAWFGSTFDYCTLHTGTDRMKKFRFDLFIETSILGHCKFILLILSLIKMEYFFPIGTSVHSGQNGNYSQASNCLPMHLDEYMGWKAFTLMVNYFWCHQHLAVSIFINIDSRCTFPKCSFFLPWCYFVEIDVVGTQLTFKHKILSSGKVKYTLILEQQKQSAPFQASSQAGENTRKENVLLHCTKKKPFL